MERFVSVKKSTSAKALAGWGLVNVLVGSNKILVCSSKNAAGCLAEAKNMTQMTLDAAVKCGVLCA